MSENDDLSEEIHVCYSNTRGRGGGGDDKYMVNRKFKWSSHSSWTDNIYPTRKALQEIPTKLQFFVLACPETGDPARLPAQSAGK